jgi:predicted TPR repeat methyltransferase
MQDFFSISLANQIKNKFGSASIITASNVFAHVNEIGDLLKGVYHLLDDDGIFVTESHYLGSIIDTL